MPWGMGPWGWAWSGWWSVPGTSPGAWGALSREAQTAWLKAHIRMVENYLAWLKEQLGVLEGS